MPVEQHEHPEYATTRDLNGVGGKVETMRERVAVNSERSETNKEQITELFELHRDTERQVGQVAQTCTKEIGKLAKSTGDEIGKVSKSVVQIRTQIGVAVAVIIIVIEIAAKVIDKFF